jgi:hypothetical protein
MSVRSSLITYLQGKGIPVQTFSAGERLLLGQMSIDVEQKQVYFETINYSFPLTHSTRNCIGHDYDPLIIDAGEPKRGSGSAEHEEREAGALDNIWLNAEAAQQASLLTILRVLDEDDNGTCEHSTSDFAATLRR